MFSHHSKLIGIATLAFLGSVPTQAWATSCPEVLGESAKLEAVGFQRLGAQATASDMLRPVLGHLACSKHTDVLDAQAGRKIRLKQPLAPSPEVRSYLEEWRGKKGSKSSGCPGVPYMVMEPGLYVGVNYPGVSDTWMKDASFEISADRKTAKHRYTQDQVEYVVTYSVLMNEHEQEGSIGCSISNSKSEMRFNALCYLALGLLGLARRKKRCKR